MVNIYIYIEAGKFISVVKQESVHISSGVTRINGRGGVQAYNLPFLARSIPNISCQAYFRLFSAWVLRIT